MTTRQFVVCALLWPVLFGAGCGKPPVEAPPVVRPVKVVTVGEAGVETTREFPGTIRATREAALSFEVAGRIIERLVGEGQQVKEGEAMARLDDRDLQASLDQVKAGLRKAEADLDRSVRIREEDPGAISTSKIDADKRGVEVYEAEMRIAEKALEDAVLRAPFAGMVARRLAENFQNVQAKETVFELQDISQLEIEISVPERDVAQGRVNRAPTDMTQDTQPTVHISALPDSSFPARVSEFATRADPATRTFQVRLVFEPPEDVRILPGMTARVNIHAETPDVVRLPSHAAVADEQGRAQVWVLDPDTMTVKAKSVRLGDMAGDEIAVLEGLSAGELVVVSGVSKLREGMKVRRHQG